MENSKKIAEANILFKCGPNAACIVKKIIDSNEYEINLKIHVLRNCIRCNGKFEPEFDAIL